MFEKLLDAFIVVSMWLHHATTRWTPLSWLVHAAAAIPLAWVFGPWAPLAVFGVREGEQLLHVWLWNRWDSDFEGWLDVFLDVAAPAVVGLVFGWSGVAISLMTFLGFPV